MKILLRGASSVALVLGVGIHAHAQTPQTVPTTTATAQSQSSSDAGPDRIQTAQAAPTTERVVVTGSLIATVPEDAPKPVEVFTFEDLEAQGTPNVTEFIRSLTTSYGDDLGFGQASPDVPQGTGFGNANLRGLGSNGTLVLMNGRNLAPWNGSFGADVNTVPMEALQAVEVLKDGASATYGAGAVGGVINFRTRRDIDAPQISIQKQFYEGSDGYYKIDFLTGWVGDNGNVLVSLSQSHEDPMLQSKRDFSSLPFNINPAPYTLTGSNPGQFQPSTSNFLTNTGAITVAFPGVQDLRNADDCRAIGGEIANVLQPGALSLAVPAVPNTSCAFPQWPFQNLVNENDQTRAYLEFNSDISDSMEVHFDINYSKSKTLQNQVPIGPASATAVDRSQDALSRRGFTANSCFGCNYVIPVQVQTYTNNGNVVTAAPGVGTGVFFQNPFIADFRTRTGTTTTTLPTTGALYMGTHWRPWLFGGNDLQGGPKVDTFERDSFIVNAGLKGQFTENTWVGSWLNGVNYDVSGQYNQYLNTYHQPDVFASRLQNALLGYGGPNCNAVDRVPTDYTSAASYNRTIGIQSDTAPGTNGCQWFNPFASAWQTSFASRTANPQFNAGAPPLAAGSTARPTGYANPISLIDWMYGDRTAEYKLEAVTLNGLLSGTVPESLFALPGGEIGWAVGVQSRQVEGRSSTRDDNEQEEAMATQSCVFPDRAVVAYPAQVEPSLGTPGCTSNNGAFFSNGRVNIVTTTPPFYYDTQTAAIFAELQLPVLDNLNFSVSGRHEEYNGGDLIGDIYSVAGKWDVTDDIYIRASYGTNYRADGALELEPGNQDVATTTYTRFGPTFQAQRVTTVSDNIGPEDDKTFNFGVGYQGRWGDHRFRASVDFFEILIEGQLATTSDTTILNDVFGTNTSAGQAAQVALVRQQANNPGLPAVGTNSSAQYANCSASLVSFVRFTGACTPGVTTAQSLSEVLRFQVNGPGFITNGIDYAVDYSHPMFGGTFAVQLAATQNLVYKAKGYDVNGVSFDPGGNRLGYANYTRTGNESRRWRANATVRWSDETHNINLRANYSSGVFNEAFVVGGLTPIVDNPGTTPDVYSLYGVYPEEYLDFDLNYIYTAPFWEELELRATILNLTDEDPSPAQGRSGYYAATGNPRGRIFEIGLTKKF
jgi:iron complex outermembrane recepter protein